MRLGFMSPIKTSTLAVALVVALAGCKREADDSSTPAQTAAPTRASATAAATSKSKSKSSFDINELDTATSACQNLDTFVNAKWAKANPIPPDAPVGACSTN